MQVKRDRDTWQSHAWTTWKVLLTLSISSITKLYSFLCIWFSLPLSYALNWILTIEKCLVVFAWRKQLVSADCRNKWVCNVIMFLRQVTVSHEAFDRNLNYFPKNWVPFEFFASISNPQHVCIKSRTRSRSQPYLFTEDFFSLNSWVELDAELLKRSEMSGQEPRIDANGYFPIENWI